MTLHTADESPQSAGRRYADLERVLAEREGIERVSDADGADSGGDGESTNSQEGEV